MNHPLIENIYKLKFDIHSFIRIQIINETLLCYEKSNL